MRESMREIMRDVPVHTGPGAMKPHIVANNTVKYARPDGAFVYRLHQTDIVVQHINGEIELNTGGWRTHTTKERLNRYISPLYIWSDRGEWYISAPSSRYETKQAIPFFDGIRVKDCRVINASEIARDGLTPLEVRRRRKLITKMIGELRGLKQLPEPGQGDCWICMMHRETPGKRVFNTLEGQTGPGQPDCLLSHIEEGYLHGTLIYNALCWAGYRDPGFIWQRENQDRAQGRKPDFASRALRRYLYRKLGVG